MIENVLNNPVLLVVALVGGLVLLVLGANWLVDGASGLAKRFNISDLVIGLTVVAFGTSMPELVVNLISVSNGVTDLAITNVLGSNIINIFVILGTTAVIYPVASQKHSRDFDIPMSLVAGLLVLAFVTIGFFGGDKGICQWEGILLLALFVVFLAESARHAKSGAAVEESYKPMKIWKASALVLFGLGGLVVGGELIVKSAVKIACDLGVSDAIIGLTVVALGTSLPELATSVVAACKQNSDIAFGNVIGSNIFNIFFVLGISAVIHPLPAYKGLEVDAVMVALGSVMVGFFIIANKEREIKRWAGALLLVMYVGYLIYRLLTM